MIEVLFVIGAYLFGSLPVLYWIGKARGFDLDPKKEDLHQALWRKVGLAEGVAGVTWDVLKGPVPPLIAWLLDFDVLTVGLSAMAVTAGQMWPAFTRFYGKERGNTTGVGAAFAVSPLALGWSLIPIAAAGAIRVFFTMRKPNRTTAESLKLPGKSDSMPLGVLVGFAILPLVAWRLDEDPVEIWIFAAFFAMIVIRRLTADLQEDLKSVPRPNVSLVLRNRFLYDRSFH
ncbi:MAG: glycerol-3-phosphate acyltransferase [Dehalococcoidia bacterium]|nr:glycerol-3-phosphate acyltransferase [Dehalococcoidia bacterium]